MLKQEKRDAKLRDLLKRVAEENPKANEKKLNELFVDAVRQDPDLVADAVDWFIERNYPATNKSN